MRPGLGLLIVLTAAAIVAAGPRAVCFLAVLLEDSLALGPAYVVLWRPDRPPRNWPAALRDPPGPLLDRTLARKFPGEVLDRTRLEEIVRSRAGPGLRTIALARLRLLDVEAANRLAPALLLDEDEMVRNTGTWMLVHHPGRLGDDVTRGLAAVLRSPSHEARSAAIDVFRARSDLDPATHLATVLRDPDPGLRAALLQALPSAPVPVGFVRGAIESGRRDPSPTVREAALRASRSLGEPVLVDEPGALGWVLPIFDGLHPVALHRNEDMRRDDRSGALTSALPAIEYAQPSRSRCPANEPAGGAGDHASCEEVIEARRLLAGPDLGLSALRRTVRFLQSPDDRVRAEVERSLPRATWSAPIRALQGSLVADHPEERLAALDALVELGAGRDPRAVLALLHALLGERRVPALLLAATSPERSARDAAELELALFPPGVVLDAVLRDLSRLPPVGPTAAASPPAPVVGQVDPGSPVDWLAIRAALPGHSDRLAPWPAACSRGRSVTSRLAGAASC